MEIRGTLVPNGLRKFQETKGNHSFSTWPTKKFSRPCLVCTQNFPKN